jgi:hypothetical protein
MEHLFSTMRGKPAAIGRQSVAASPLLSDKTSPDKAVQRTGQVAEDVADAEAYCACHG